MDINTLYEEDLSALSDAELIRRYRDADKAADTAAFQVGITYNLKDVALVDHIDSTTSLLELALTVAFLGGVNFSDAFGTTHIWDSTIYRALYRRKIACPPSKRYAKTPYAGGYVKEPIPQKYQHIASFDLASLYPSILIQYNMSPETLVENPYDEAPIGVDFYLNKSNDIPSFVKDGDYCVAANGALFRRDELGVIPGIIKPLFAQRKEIKKTKFKIDIEVEKTPDPEKSAESMRLGNREQAIKILLNSLYGALGNVYFRYFRKEIAEGVTLTGQLTVRWAETAINKAMNKWLKTIDTDYIIAADTDSNYVNLHPLVTKVNPKDPIGFMSKVCEEKITPVLEKAFAELFDRMNAYENRMVMEREVLADKGIWTAKKRYVLQVQDQEGVRFKEPKLKVMGIEAVKSSTPEVVRKKFMEAYKIMLNGSEEELQVFIEDFYDEFSSLPPEDVSFPRGLSDIEKWTDEKNKTYRLSTPIHVRGAILYNFRLKELGLDRKYEPIQNGAKVKFCHLKLPNPLRENVISYPDYLPRELGLAEYIDYKTQFDKTFKEPLRLVSNPINWHLDRQDSIESFFS